MSQAKLIADRRFWPLFCTQFLGAFNDNFLKNAIVILITFRAMHVGGLPPEQMVALSGGIFILPFFLFSATAGQISDRMDKARLMRWVKAAEIGIMAVGAVGFLTANVPVLLCVLFAMGIHSTLFGPSKYSILPQLLRNDELVGANALIETGTTLAILLGTIAGGVLIGLPNGEIYVAIGMLLVAAGGFLTSLRIQTVPPVDATTAVQWDLVRPTLSILRIGRRTRSVFLSTLGISWFWAFGAAFLSVFPGYAKDVLRGNEHTATLLLAMFSVGIGVGSMLCGRLSRHRLELGLVPVGSIGMTLFTLDLYWVGDPWALDPGAWVPYVRVLIDMGFIAVFGGFFIVPLYTLIQTRSEPSERSRVIAANNIVNAVFIVSSAGMLVGLFAAGVTVPQIFLILATLNAAVALYIYTLLPEFFMRFLTFVLSNVMYRLDIVGVENIPAEGAAVLVCNHVTYIDWLFISAACPRPARFVMDKAYFEKPILRQLCRDAKVIPIAQARDDPDALRTAFDRIAAELDEGQVVCIFPEGTLTRDGNMNPFRQGIERILSRNPVPVVPMALGGLWGSYFSRKDGAAFRKPFRRGVLSRVHLRIGSVVPAGRSTAASLEASVALLLRARKEIT